jgi:hypothetical protein
MCECHAGKSYGLLEVDNKENRKVAAINGSVKCVWFSRYCSLNFKKMIYTGCVFSSDAVLKYPSSAKAYGNS